MHEKTVAKEIGSMFFVIHIVLCIKNVRRVFVVAGSG